MPETCGLLSDLSLGGKHKHHAAGLTADTLDSHYSHVSTDAD